MSRFHETAQKFQLFSKNWTQKLPFLLSISSETGTKKRPKLGQNSPYVWFHSLDNKNDSFCDHFWHKLEFLGSFMKPWFWHKCWNCQFQFFPAKLTVSIFYANISVSWNCPKISTFCQKLVTKPAIFICQFQVKLWHNKIKKWTRFFLKLVF